MSTTQDPSREADEGRPSFRFGSHDSIDEDRAYLFDSLPDPVSAKAFCKKSHENRNIIVLRDGVVSECYKGNPDEMNNALLATYELHEQAHPLPIIQAVTRNVPLKVVRTTRSILSMLSRSAYRQEIKEALSSQSQQRRVEVLKGLDLSSVGLDVHQRKALAFQLVQALALLEGEEHYTKSSLAAARPAAAPLLAREEDADASVLNELRDAFLSQLREVYIRQQGSLNLFCYISSVKVRDWTPYNMQCRGTIIDLKTERCVAFPYEKFFKLDECPGWMREEIEAQPLDEVFEKMDGSFVSVYRDETGELAFACKGNFDAEQARKAEEISRRYKCSALDTTRYHFTFEVIYPENRFPGGFAIVDYGPQEALYLTGARERHTHRMLNYSELAPIAAEMGCPMPRCFDRDLGALLTEASAPEWTNFEGWVANVGGKRVKIKTKGYNEINRMANQIKHGSHRILREYIEASEEEWAQRMAYLPPAFRPPFEAEVALFEGLYEQWEENIREALVAWGSKPMKELVALVQEQVSQPFQKPMLRMAQGRPHTRSLRQLVCDMLLEEGKTGQPSATSLLVT